MFSYGFVFFFSIKACRKAWFSDAHNVKRVLIKFKEQITKEFTQQLGHTTHMVLTPLLNPDEDDNENLREKFKEIPLLDSFKMIYQILQKLKKEACKTLPATAYLVNFSECQQKCIEQIEKVVGFDRLPTIKDKPSLPYIEAFLHETLRMSSIAPMAVPHKTTCDTSIGGYKLPKDSKVNPSFDSIISH